MMIKSIDLFAGIGGIDLGFYKAGFETAWANEMDDDACKTFRKTFSNVNLIEGDVHNLDTNILSYVDVIAAGFPCQPFSVCGQKKGFFDERGNCSLKLCELQMLYNRL